ncbi:MAG: LTA synthase family protein [Candidatus Nealsonbacteria bacterium]|nr:LTA synthase family protein [Candidatus Nealsonbacteria bacterium]
MTSIFALLWATEIFVVQYVTLTRTYDPHWLAAKTAVRFSLDLAFVTTCVMVLPRAVLAVVAVAAVPVNLALVAYCHYFHETLSYSVVASSWQEGAGVAGFGAALVPWPAWILLGLSLVAKLLLLRAAGGGTLPRRLRAATGLACVGFYIAVLVGLNQTNIKFANVRRCMASSDLMVTYGYSPAWIAEFVYFSDDTLLEHALAQRRISSDKLTPIERHVELPRRVVVVQVESLGYSIVGHSAAGKEITPFMNRLRATSALYRIRAIHYTCSANADFAMLNAVEPSRQMVPYKIPGYPYGDALPHLLGGRGYRTVALHGMSGAFFARAPAYQQMGFSQRLFREQLCIECGARLTNSIVADRDVFEISARLLEATTEPVFHFITTMSSHGPFRYIKPDEAEIYPSPSGVRQHYLNSMRYVDNALRDYFERLPKGTLVVVYGDHPANVARDEFAADYSGAAEYVPCFIHVTGENLATRQETRGRPVATDGSLSLIDVANYLRTSAGCRSSLETNRSDGLAKRDRPGRRAL